MAGLLTACAACSLCERDDGYKAAHGYQDVPVLYHGNLEPKILVIMPQLNYAAKSTYYEVFGPESLSLELTIRKMRRWTHGSSVPDFDITSGNITEVAYTWLIRCGSVIPNDDHIENCSVWTRSLIRPSVKGLVFIGDEVASFFLKEKANKLNHGQAIRHPRLGFVFKTKLPKDWNADDCTLYKEAFDKILERVK